MDQLFRPAGRTSWTDQLDGSAGQTSWTDQFSLFGALASLHIRRLTFQFVHCHSFRVQLRPCFVTDGLTYLLTYLLTLAISRGAFAPKKTKFTQFCKMKSLSVAKLSLAFPYHLCGIIYVDLIELIHLNSLLHDIKFLLLTNQRPGYRWQTDRHFEILVQGSLQEYWTKTAKQNMSSAMSASSMKSGKAKFYFWGRLHFWGCLHFLGRLHFWSCLRF